MKVMKLPKALQSFLEAAETSGEETLDQPVRLQAHVALTHAGV